MNNVDESKLSLHDQVMLHAVCKGYKITKDGTVISSLGRNIKPSIKHANGVDYYRFSVNYKGISKSVKVHRLQAYFKFGNKLFDEGMQVRHLNGNSLDNSWDNIELGTHQDNQDDISKETRRNRAIKVSRYIRRFTDEELEPIFEDRYINKLSYDKISAKYSVAKSTLAFIFNKSIFAEGYKVRFASYD